jgi:hypothetical protein
VRSCNPRLGRFDSCAAPLHGFGLRTVAFGGDEDPVFYRIFILVRPGSGLDVTHTIRELRQLTDDQLIEEHDAIAPNTFVGIDYYLNELARRDAHRQTRQIVVLTVVIAVCTVVGVPFAEIDAPFARAARARLEEQRLRPAGAGRPFAAQLALMAWSCSRV